MKIVKLPGGTAVVPTALPLYFPGGKTAVLIIHGYTGYPGEYRYLGSRLADAGFSVYIPRLPGHGTNRADFLQTGSSDWLRHCTDRYLDLQAQYERVYIAGLSLGGILTAILAGVFQPSKIALLAPAVTNRDKRIVLSPVLKKVIPRVRGRFREESDDPDRQFLWEEYWKYKYAGSVAEVFKLQRAAKRCLGKVHSRTLIIVSKTDPTVSWKVSKYIEQRLPAETERKTVLLEDSRHVIVNGNEKETVADELVAWFSEQSGQIGIS